MIALSSTTNSRSGSVAPSLTSIRFVARRSTRVGTRTPASTSSNTADNCASFTGLFTTPAHQRTALWPIALCPGYASASNGSDCPAGNARSKCSNRASTISFMSASRIANSGGSGAVIAATTSPSSPASVTRIPQRVAHAASNRRFVALSLASNNRRPASAGLATCGSVASSSFVAVNGSTT